MNRACEEIIGHATRSTEFRSPGAPIGSSFATRWSRIGHELDEDLFARLRAAYLRHLREEICNLERASRTCCRASARCSTRSAGVPMSSSGC